jgi:hypothetical protein
MLPGYNTGTLILQMVLIGLGLGGGVVCLLFFMFFAQPRLVRYLQRKFGVNITVGQILWLWDVEGGSPAKNFAVGLLYWPWLLANMAALWVPLFLLYALAESL